MTNNKQILRVLSWIVALRQHCERTHNHHKHTMPCDTITTTAVDLGKVDPQHLTAALSVLGLSPQRQGDLIRFGRNESYNCATGQLQLATTRGVNEIKRAYAAQVVQSQAKRFGWQMKEVAPNKWAVNKR